MSKIRFSEPALTFDDVLLRPAESRVIPHETDVRTRLSRNIKLNIPIISAAMDTVTEAKMAIAMAQAGGIGVIHRNLTPEQQVEQVTQVKKFEAGIVHNPMTITAEQTLKEALSIMESLNISGIPVCESHASKKLVGILTHRDVRFATDLHRPVHEFMTSERLITVRDKTDLQEAKKILHKNRIEKLIVVDKDYRCVGLITVKDIERIRLHPNACKDDRGRLRVAASIGTGAKHLERAAMLIEAEADAIVIDTAHGHSQSVFDCLKTLKSDYPEIDIIAGNVATEEAALYLAKAGVDAIKVGIGPGSVCTTRIVAGVGIPQLTAIVDVAKVAQEYDIPLIADGGIRYSGDLAKALASGAEVAMIGSLLAGTDESPGDVFLYNGRSYKSYRGMGSAAAMARGSADRYFQQEVQKVMKLVAEGVESRVPYRGATSAILYQLVGGLRSAMGYTGCPELKQFRTKTEFIRISPSALRESHVHDVAITREENNYSAY